MDAGWLAWLVREVFPKRSTVEEHSPPLRRAIVVVMIGATMAFLDSTTVNIALATLGKTLHAFLVQVQWVITGYLLAFGAIIPVTDGWGRRFGPSRVYMTALAPFTLGSILCALSGNIGWLIASRVIQGLGGGTILPALSTGEF